jgi:hypothetical protein
VKGIKAKSEIPEAPPKHHTCCYSAIQSFVSIYAFGQYYSSRKPLTSIFSAFLFLFLFFPKTSLLLGNLLLLGEVLLITSI